MSPRKKPRPTSTTEPTQPAPVPAPAPEPTTTPTPSGRQVGISTGGGLWWYGTTDIGADLNMVRDLGATWVRLDMYWSMVERNAGYHDWTKPDVLHSAARARGLNVLWVAHRTPSWARGGVGGDLTYPTNAGAYGAFLGRCAARYPGSAWEMWNEPNGTWAASDIGQTGARKLAAMCVSAATAIRAADSTAKVIGPGILRSAGSGSNLYRDTDYLGWLYDGGFAEARVDALGFHPYAIDPPVSPLDTVNQWSGWNRIWQYVSSARLRQPVISAWLTEVGYCTSSDSYGVTEAKQAQYVTDAVQRFDVETARGLVTGPLCWYQHRDGGARPYTDREKAFGLAYSDRSPKPAWSSFVTAVKG